MKLVKIFVLSFLLTVVVSAVKAQTSMASTQADSLKTISIKVKGVTCGNDLKTIAANVEKIKGVCSCKAQKPGPTTKFEVKYNQLLTTEKEIYAAIEATAGCENPTDRPYKVKQ